MPIYLALRTKCSHVGCGKEFEVGCTLVDPRDGARASLCPEHIIARNRELAMIVESEYGESIREMKAAIAAVKGQAN